MDDARQMLLHFAMAQKGEAPDWAVAAEWIDRHPERAVDFMAYMADAELDLARPRASNVPEDQASDAVEKTMARFRRRIADQKRRP